MPATNEHPFAVFIRRIGKGKAGRRSLSQAEAEQAMQFILQGEVEPVQLGAFLMLLRVKEETAEEIAGFVAAARTSIDRSRPTPLQADLDWSSYAGKRRQPPWFLLSALLLAKQGPRIFMHGSSGHTAGRLYTEEILRAMGIPLADSWHQCEQQLQSHCFAFMPLRTLCPQLQQLIDLRPLFGLRSPVHTLARLLNPLRADSSLQSVFHPAYCETHHGAAQRLGEKNSAVFKGESGEVEYRPQAEISVKSLRNGSDNSYRIARQPLAQNSEERGSEQKTTLNCSDSAALLKSVWHGEIDHPYAEAAVIGTTAIALTALGTAEDYPHARKQAERLWRERPAQYYG